MSYTGALFSATGSITGMILFGLHLLCLHRGRVQRAELLLKGGAGAERIVPEVDSYSEQEMRTGVTFIFSEDIYLWALTITSGIRKYLSPEQSALNALSECWYILLHKEGKELIIEDLPQAAVGFHS